MTAIPAPRATAGTIISATPFERALLRSASALDVFVAARLERRGSAAYRRAAAAQSASAHERIAAEARGAIGLLPR
jgi:hypothetical protein